MDGCNKCLTVEGDKGNTNDGCISSDTHLMELNSLLRMWNQRMRPFTLVRSFLHWTRLKLAPLSS